MLRAHDWRPRGPAADITSLRNHRVRQWCWMVSASYGVLGHIEYRSVASRQHDNALQGSKQHMHRCWIAVKTARSFVPDCIQHSQSHTCRFVSPSEGT